MSSNQNLSFSSANNAELPIVPDETKTAPGGGFPPGASGSSAISTVSPSGDYQIDTLLGGVKWQGSTITYSFYETGTVYYGSENVSEVDQTTKDNVRFILEEVLEPYLDIDFVEVADSTNTYSGFFHH